MKTRPLFKHRLLVVATCLYLREIQIWPDALEASCILAFVLSMPQTSSGPCELSKRPEALFSARASFAQANRICFVGTQTTMSWRFGTSCLHRLTRSRLDHTSELRARDGESSTGLANAREAPDHGGQAVRSPDRFGLFHLYRPQQ